ncbi:MAG: insulinase family protein [Candidatus Marinimicrobia bacterium]|nr:insulinase family protein [Candidatus Neomarinimicrobiota bacterium]MCF7828697.1 insulinase family protein [Candidatus Neomarinimicrobiota bacterium]MCF7880438.1 insulinase family protein [Candidatus Neomarinimicrobiota bacterium]
MKPRILLILFALCVAALPAIGAEEAPFETMMLDNGMEIVVIENHTVPLATIEIVVKNGAYTEPPEYDGLSHLYEHMFFKANKGIPSQEAYMDRARELGMVWNGTTSDERVNYFFTLSKDSLRSGMVFMKNAIRYPLFLEEEMAKENHVVDGEFDRNEASPFFQVYRATNQKMWTRFWSRKNTIGDREVILSATPEKMRTIQHRYYVPNNSALIVSGDVEPETVFAIAKEMYGDWERAADPFEEYPVPEHPPIESAVDTVVTQPVNVSMLMIGWHGPKALDDVKSTFAADVFSFILGQQTSKFQKNMVDSGIALQADISYYTLQHTGPITANIVSAPGNVLKAKEALMAEIEKFTDPDYFTDEQLETAKNLLEVDAIYNREKASEYAHTVSFWWAVTGLDYYRDYIENLRAVSRQDIVNYVNTYIKGKPHVVAALVSPETQESLQLTKGSLVQ